MHKIAVLVSGSGSNLQSIIDAIAGKSLDCKIEAVISDNEKAFALKRASDNGIPSYILDKKKYGKNLSDEILNILNDKVELIVLAGFLSILQGNILDKFHNRIINIHPSLIPAFCGDGMYGLNVHRKAIEYGVKISGCTVHFVNSLVDGGPIILQKHVEVQDHDTAESLQKRILVEEHKALVEAIRLLTENSFVVDGRRVIFND